MKNINVLRLEITIDDNNKLLDGFFRMNKELPQSFNDEFQRLFNLPIDELVIELKEALSHWTEITMDTAITSLALHNTGMAKGQVVVNDKVINARVMKYVRDEKS